MKSVHQREETKPENSFADEEACPQSTVGNFGKHTTTHAITCAQAFAPFEL